MEYRLRYRDIPWGVALTVLPGKIIGRLIIAPVFHIAENWKRILIKISKTIGTISLILLVLGVVITLIDLATKDKLSISIVDIYKYVVALLS